MFIETAENAEFITLKTIKIMKEFENTIYKSATNALPDRATTINVLFKIYFCKKG